MSPTTRSSDSVPGIEIGPVTDWIVANVSGVEGPLRFERIGEGQSNLTFKATPASGPVLVVRRPPLGAVLKSAHDMGREYHLLVGLGGIGMPVPKALAFCEDVEVTGAPFFVMEEVRGVVVATPADAEGLSLDARRRAAEGLPRCLAMLQGVDLERAGLDSMRRPGSFIERQLRRWRKQWEASKTGDLPLVEDLADRLLAHMPDEEETVLVHGDYKLDNLIVDRDGSVSAVLDWELSTVGDPLADVGLMWAYFTEGCDPDGLFQSAVNAMEGFPTADELVAVYEKETGRTMANLDYYVAFAYWKTAVIVQGVYKRWLENPANGADNAGELEAWVARLSRLGDEAAQRQGI